MQRADIVAGTVLAALGAFIVSEAAQWDYHSPEGPGPGFFPLWYGVAMIALSAILVFQGATAKAGADAGKPVRWPEVGRVLTVWAGFVACIASLKLLGFVVGFGLFVLFMVAGMYRRSWPAALAVAGGCATGFYLLFTVALDVRLPANALGF